MDWSNERVLQFIDDYRACKVLWHFRDPHYNSNSHKIAALTLLADKYDTSVEVIKNKINYLLKRFHRENKRLNKIKYLSPGDPQPRWICYDALLFVAINNEPSDDYETDEDIDSEIDIIEPAADLVDLVDSDDPETINSPQEPSLHTPTSEISQHSNENKKRKIVTQDEYRVEEAQQIVKESVQRDEFATYGEYLANEIRKLQPNEQTVVKYLFNTILFDAAMGKLDPTNTVPYSHPTMDNSYMGYKSTTVATAGLPSPLPSTSTSTYSWIPPTVLSEKTTKQTQSQ